MGIPTDPAMTDRTKALATVWGCFWAQVEAKAEAMSGVPGVLAISIEPIDEALREALSQAYDEGLLGGLQAALQAAERNN